jgi:hypothetical protein
MEADMSSGSGSGFAAFLGVRLGLDLRLRGTLRGDWCRLGSLLLARLAAAPDQNQGVVFPVKGAERKLGMSRFVAVDGHSAPSSTVKLPPNRTVTNVASARVVNQNR